MRPPPDGFQTVPADVFLPERITAASVPASFRLHTVRPPCPPFSWPVPPAPDQHVKPARRRFHWQASPQNPASSRSVTRDRHFHSMPAAHPPFADGFPRSARPPFRLRPVNRAAKHAGTDADSTRVPALCFQ